MKSIFLLSFILSVFVACSSKSNKAQYTTTSSTESSEKRGSISSDKTRSESHKNTSDEWQWEDCVRGEPEPICKKSSFKNHSFRVDSTSSSTHIGHEKATLKNGDILEITNAGCEYYVLEFKFTTSRFAGDTTDFVYWCDAAIQLMKSIQENIEVSFTLEDSYPVLEKFFLESESPELGEQKQFNDSEIGNYISLDRIEQLSKKKYAVTIRYAAGPL